MGQRGVKFHMVCEGVKIEGANLKAVAEVLESQERGNYGDGEEEGFYEVSDQMWGSEQGGLKESERSGREWSIGKDIGGRNVGSGRSRSVDTGRDWMEQEVAVRVGQGGKTANKDQSGWGGGKGWRVNDMGCRNGV